MPLGTSGVGGVILGPGQPWLTHPPNRKIFLRGKTKLPTIMQWAILHPASDLNPRAGRTLLCGGGGDTEAHFPNPPPSLAAVTGGGVQGGGARPAGPGGGGVNPTSISK